MLGHVPVRQAVTATIVADQPHPVGEKTVQRAAELDVPVLLEVIEPGRRPHHGRPAADPIDRELDAVGGAAVLETPAPGPRRDQVAEPRRLQGEQVAASAARS